MLTFLCLLACLVWFYLWQRHAHFYEFTLPARLEPLAGHLPRVVICVPARNEAENIRPALESLLAQDYAGPFIIRLIDDASTDATRAIAEELAGEYPGKIDVLSAPPPPEGWTGKLNALQAAVEASGAAAPDYFLFTDADITHPADSLTQLVARAEREKKDVVSIMVKLNCQSFWEKLLIPAFVYFFKQLYPFRLAADPHSRVAAAAGGVLLLRRSLLERIGGLTSVRGELIDDCALARRVKDAAGWLWVGLSDQHVSLRRYDTLAEIWNMVARTAYTQLGTAPLALVGALLGLFVIYAVPVLGVLSGGWAFVLGGAALVMMVITYTPAVRFYGLPGFYAFTLPAAATLYAAMTFDSARRSHAGEGGQWKGRTHGAPSAAS